MLTIKTTAADGKEKKGTHADGTKYGDVSVYNRQ